MSAPKPQIPGYMKFVLGGSAGMMGTCVVQPLDLVKTRMQISGLGGAKREYKNSFDCMATVIRKEGFLAIYTGLGAGLLRQATYTTGRLGVYSTLNDLYKSSYASEPNFIYRLGMGMTAGAFGAFLGTPAEVALIRMTADGRLPMEQRRNYTNVFNALARIIREEGTVTLWRGCVPTVGRAMIVNMAQLATYSQAKSFFARTFELKDGFELHFMAAMLSGLVTTIASMPMDMAKTRIQNMKKIDGVPQYKGAIDVIIQVAKKEGIFSLWKGFTPYYCRLGPHTVLTFVFLEILNQSYYKYVLGTTGGSGL